MKSSLVALSLCAGGSAVSAASAAYSADPPQWPPPIAPVWPTRWASLNYTGDFPVGPPPYDVVTLVGSWYYDWPTNRWRQDTCTKFTPDKPATCKVELWEGMEQKTYTFTPDLKTCTYVTSMVPAITHPDSFVQGDYAGRAQLDGHWADTNVVDTEGWIGYNFTLDSDISSNRPIRDCGPTQTSPPWALACSNHHTVDVTMPEDSVAWEKMFTLPKAICTPKLQDNDSNTLLPSQPSAFDRYTLLAAKHYNLNLF